MPSDAIPDGKATARWLLVEWRRDGTIKYALSNLPPDAAIEHAVRWWKERWQVARGYEQLKGKLGLDHFEGRSWPGFHHDVPGLRLPRPRATPSAGTAETPDSEGSPTGEAGRGA